MKAISLLLLTGLSLTACEAPDVNAAAPVDVNTEASDQRTAIIEELTSADPLEKGARNPLMGLWHARATFPTAVGSTFLDMYWVVGRSSAWHVVYAYADEGLTQPLLRWDLLRAYDVTGVAAHDANEHLVTWDNLHATLFAYRDSPALFRAVGIDDCHLRAGHLTNIANGCGAPFFPFARCTLLDFARVEGDLMTFGDPQVVDRCVERPTRDEAWSFARVALTSDIARKLLGEP